MREVTVKDIQSTIITLPNRPPAMLASSVAAIYGVKTKRANEAVRRNPDRFPEDFVFQATKNEIELIRSQNATKIYEGDEEPSLRSQNVTKIYAGDDVRPWMFTRNGANMLSAVLKSDVAAKRSVQIMRAFSALEESAMAGASGSRAGEAITTLFGDRGVFARKKIADLPPEYVPAVQELVEAIQGEAARAAIRMISALRKSGFPENFLDKLILYRRRGNTQRETAKLLDVSNSTVQRYEKLAFKMGMIRKDGHGKVVA